MTGNHKKDTGQKIQNAFTAGYYGWLFDDVPGLYEVHGAPAVEPVDAIAHRSGFDELDAIYRMYPGQFTVVTGLAGSGKSTFLFNVVCNWAQQGLNSFLYVPENERHLLAKLTRIWDRRGGLDLPQQRLFLQSAEPKHYRDQPQTFDWVLDRAALAVERLHLDVVLIDPWNEIERAKPKDMLMTDYIGQCLTWIKQFTRAYKVAFIMVAHPTKAGVVDGKVPTLADIEGSMNWYNKCDNGLIVVREKYPSRTTQVISAKVREQGAGRIGTAYFSVDAVTERFTPVLEVAHDR